MQFKPSKHLEHCHCVLTTEGAKGTYKSEPERMPAKKACTVWLLNGAPLTDRKVYYWRCNQNNTACDIYYDGTEEGFLAYSSQTVVSLAVPMDFVLQLITGRGTTFSGFVQHKELLNELCFGRKEEECLYMAKKGLIKVNFYSSGTS